MAYTNTNPQHSLFPIPMSEADKMILRNGLRFYLNVPFSIPYPITSTYFKYYKLLYWTGHYILESIESGMIVRDGIAFTVRFHRNLTRGKILRNRDVQYALSFRAVLDDWNLNPVVLISAVEPEPEPESV